MLNQSNDEKKRYINKKLEIKDEQQVQCAWKRISSRAERNVNYAMTTKPRAHAHIQTHRNVDGKKAKNLLALVWQAALKRYTYVNCTW